MCVATVIDVIGDDDIDAVADVVIVVPDSVPTTAAVDCVNCVDCGGVDAPGGFAVAVEVDEVAFSTDTAECRL